MNGNAAATRVLLTAFSSACLFSANCANAEEIITIYAHPQSVSIDNAIQAQEALDKIPGGASLIDSSQWSDQRAETIKDITDYVPGVVAQPRNGAESSRLSIRGSGLANIFQGRGLLVLQDGIPINMADGEFEFPVIDPWLITYAEVFPGANALAYGASTFGGAINFITPNGKTDNGTELRAEGGSFGTLHGQASYGQQWQTGDLFASATDFSQDGYRRQNNQDTNRFNGNLGWRADDDFSNRIYISHTHSDADIPGALSLAQTRADPRQANPANAAGNYQRDLDISRIADKSAWQNGADRIDTAVYYTNRILDNPVTTYEFQRTNDVGVRAKFTHQSGLNQWIAGFNYAYGFGDETRYRNIGGSPGAHILDRSLSAATTEVYAQYEQHLMGKLFGVADMQGSYATRNIQQSYPYMAKQDEDYSGFSPRIGLRYDIAYQQQVFANLSRSFEPPTWSELSGGNTPGFNSLKAQRATTVEVGTRLTFNSVHVQAAYYHGWVKNEFVNYLFADGSTATINAARTKRDGIELGLDGDILENIWLKKDAFNLRAAYTFSHFTLDHDPLYGNNALPGVPEHYLRAELLYKHPSGIAFGPNIEWSPKAQLVDLTNSLSSSGYAIFGVRTFWQSPNQKLDIFIEGRNLLDRNYIDTTNVIPDAGGQDGRYFYPGEGRAVYVGFRWKL